MRLIRYILNRQPIPVCAVIVAGALVSGGYVHDYIVNVVQPMQLARVMAEVEGGIADADLKFRLNRYGQAALGYRYAIEAHADKLDRDVLSRLYHRLGTAQRKMADSSSAIKNLGLAAKALQRAIELRPIAEVALDYAESQTELGRVHSALAALKPEATDLAPAMTAYGNALKVYTADTNPYEYANVNRLVANSHRDAFHTGKDQQDERMAPAISAYGKALAIFDAEKYPTERGDTLIDMGLAYQQLAQGTFVRTNTNKALDAYRDALTVFTQARHPRDFGRAQKHLGDALMVMAERGAPAGLSSAERMRHRYRHQREGRRALELASQFAGAFSLSTNGDGGSSDKK